MVDIVSDCYTSKRRGECTHCESSFLCWNLKVFTRRKTFMPFIANPTSMEDDFSRNMNQMRQIMREHVNKKWKGKSIKVLQDYILTTKRERGKKTTPSLMLLLRTIPFANWWCAPFRCRDCRYTYVYICTIVQSCTEW